MDDEPVEAVLAAVRAARKRGELFEAYDRAKTWLDDHGPDPALAYEAVLCLARAGANELARRRYREFGLGPELGLDGATLLARLAKDEALALDGAARGPALRRAAAAYRDAYRRYPAAYPAINAATLYLLAGDPVAARHHALVARSHLTAMPGPPDFWGLATLAEAALLLDEPDAAVQAIAAAVARPEGNLGDLASSRRQLHLVVAAKGLDPALLAALAAPGIAHFTGHRLTPPGRSGRFPAAAEAQVARAIAAAVARHRIQIGYGALASGGDMLFAEAILAAGGEVHGVLPFATEDFIAVSVADAGPDWVARFRRLLGHPRLRLSHATDDPHLGDDDSFAYAARYAMGLAVQRAAMLDGEAVQLALWDGHAADGPAGTGADVACWRDRLGRPTVIIWPLAATSPPPAAAGRPEPGDRRVLRALLFCDVAGFSRLDDARAPAFFRQVMGRLAAVMAGYGPAVMARNSWGDAIHAVIGDAPAAAALMLDLQDAMTGLDLAGLGLPPDLALRVGGHLGPVYQGFDRVVGAPGFYGAQVTRCARIEPVAFPGKVFVSEAFAAELALSGGAFACDYVGTIPLAKGFGRMPMYLLRRRTGGATMAS